MYYTCIKKYKYIVLRCYSLGDLKKQIMRKITLLLVSFFLLACIDQDNKKEEYTMTISPMIDKDNKENKIIIESLKQFLQTKNISLTENEFWILTDFQKYIYPYHDIYFIESSKEGQSFYQPTLMEIISTDKLHQKIVKVAFIGHNNETNENQLKTIYNVVANIQSNKVLFSKYLDYVTDNWKTVSIGSLIYKISPNKLINKAEIIEQQRSIEKICKFFQCEPLEITYYSCVNPIELFQIKGFDYYPMMYVDSTGGLADYGNIVFSGNNSEIYTHEITHIYIKKYFPQLSAFFNEGIATLIAGSGKNTYQWHRKKMNQFMEANKDYNFADHTDIYERNYFEKETPIPYLTSALILERTVRLFGKEALINILKSDDELWIVLGKVGLTKDNINQELQKEIKLPPISIFSK